MRIKLSKYYSLTRLPFVYPDAVILEPSGKLLLFEQKSFKAHYKNQYSQACRARYIENYESQYPIENHVEATIPCKCKHGVDAAEDYVNDYYTALAQAEAERGDQNEYDLYLGAPRAPHRTDCLSWWKLTAVLTSD